MAETGARTRDNRIARRKVRIAFVEDGGPEAPLHFPFFYGAEDVEIAAVARTRGTFPAGVAETLGIPAIYSDHVEMMERERPDAVFVTVSPLTRYDVAVAVLEMGCHLFVARPPGLTAEQVRRLASTARKKKAIAGVLFYRRYSPLLRAGKSLCLKDGPVHTAVTTFYKHSLGRGPVARGGVDILTFDAIHAVDVRRLGATHTTAHCALVTFRSGATGVLLTNWMSGRRMFTVEIHSPGSSCLGDIEEGFAFYRGGRAEPEARLPALREGSDRERYRKFGFTSEVDIIRAGWHEAIDRHFVDCIRTRRQPETSLEDAVKTMELVDAIYQSRIAHPGS
jgi:predicted dehydrogenase